MAQISQNQCGSFLENMRRTRQGVHWMWPMWWNVTVATKQIWATFGMFGRHVVLLWLTCGPDLANRSGLPKCHHSTWHVGWMTGSLVQIFAKAILLCELGDVVFLFASYKQYREETSEWTQKYTAELMCRGSDRVCTLAVTVQWEIIFVLFVYYGV